MQGNDEPAHTGCQRRGKIALTLGADASKRRTPTAVPLVSRSPTLFEVTGGVSGGENRTDKAGEIAEYMEKNAIFAGWKKNYTKLITIIWQNKKR